MKIHKNKLINLHKKWKKLDIQWLRSNYNKFTYKEIAKKLGRTEHAIKDIVISHGWGKRNPRWSQEEIYILKKMFGNISIVKLSKQLSRTKNSILSKFRRLRINKYIC